MAADADMLITRVDRLLQRGVRQDSPDFVNQNEVLNAINQHEGQVLYLTKQIGTLAGATSMNLRRLDVIREQLAALKYHQNYQLALISRIPSELLHHIFSLLVNYYVDLYHLSNQSHLAQPFDPLEWISITHVCHRWRQIMINDPHFWTQISPSQSPEWTREMIVRSLNLPIFVKVDCFDMTPDAYGVVGEIFEQSIRMRELSLIIPHINTVSHVLTKPAPNIQRFAIRIFRQLTAPVLPSNIFGGTAPLLRHLSLECCQLHLESSLWTNLTHLRLASARLDITISQFLGIIRRMHGLKELSLETALPLDSRRFHLTEAIIPIHLPNLAKLSLTQPSDFASILLEYLDLPLQPQVRLALRLQRPSVVALNIILDKLYSVVTAPSLIRCRRLIVEDLSERSIRIAGSKERSERELHFVLQLADNHYNLTADDYLSLKSQFIGLSGVKSHVQTLHLRGAKAGDMIAMIHFPEVDMVVTDRAAALAWLSHASTAHNEELPKLRSLVFTEPLTVEIQGVETSGRAVLEALKGYLSLVNRSDFKLALVHLPEADRDGPELTVLHELVWKVSFSNFSIVSQVLFPSKFALSKNSQK